MKTGDETAATVWGAVGHAYDEISFMVSDALAHAAQRLAPEAGESVLDVATGTGWTARNLARSGARVTAIDLSPGLLAAAQELSAHVRPPITFRQADAEALPFEDGQFDAVASTFGVMFDPDQQRAARELGRVCRPGGRLCLATWPTRGYVADFFALTASYAERPPAGLSPLLWGVPEHVERLLGDAFDLGFEEGVNRAYYPGGEQAARHYETCFGPVKELHERLDEGRRNQFHHDLVEFHERYRSRLGLTVQRPYLLVLGTRR